LRIPEPGCVLDNTVISTLHQAGVLDGILGLWQGRWLVPQEVREEAAKWRAEGQRVIRLLDHLNALHVISYTVIDPRMEGLLFASLNRSLGAGEAATIAIAHSRHLGVALDDRAAQNACGRLNPQVYWIATEDILTCAVAEGHTSLSEAEAIWATTGIRDPNRRVSC
jgi:predicted nucleic acid-binding protein